jgi:hypothetical protein
MRSPKMEDLPRREGIRRGHALDHDWRRGADLGHQTYLRMIRFLRGQVGKHWTEALADLDQVVRGWHIDPQVARDQRQQLGERLFAPRRLGVRARDGELSIDPLTGRLCFEQSSHKRNRALEAFTLDELSQEPERIGR